MTSLRTMIQRLSGLLGTQDLTDWEQQFVRDLAERTGDGEDTRLVSPKQAAVLEKLFDRHFAA